MLPHRNSKIGGLLAGLDGRSPMTSLSDANGNSFQNSVIHATSKGPECLLQNLGM